MALRSKAGSRARVVLLVVLGWTAIALVFAAQQMLYVPRPPLLTALVPQLISWWSWAAFTPVCWLLARRSLDMRLARRAALHLVAGPLISAGCSALQGAARVVFHQFQRPHTLSDGMFQLVVQYTAFNLLAYLMVMAVASAILYARQAGDRAINAARAEALLSRARLAALAARLRPHFLFNTLHAISALVVEDPLRANQMITRLSELLRLTMRWSDGAEVDVGDELELLDHYVAIQEARFGDRLHVEFQVEPEANLARLPAFLLQPLVENAIRHGALNTGEEAVGEVTIGVRRRDGRLLLEVRDNGPGFPPASATAGLGLATTRERLVQRYGADTMTQQNLPGGGAVVRIDLPFETDVRADR